jgi:NADH dehydrogenase
MTTTRGTVLVTGAAGLVGTHSCRRLAERGWQVRALVRDVAKAELRLVGTGSEIVAADLRDAAAVMAAMRGADAVVHLAAIAIERPGQDYTSVNMDATATLIDAARAAGVRRFIHMSQNGASSASPYPFLQSKGAAEDLVRATGLAWTVLRPSVIFGPEDEFVNVLARLVRLSPVVYPLPGGGVARFQPVAVDNVAMAVALALEDQATIGLAYALGGPEPLSLRQIAVVVLAAMHARRILVNAPVSMLRPLVAVAQKLLPNPPVTTGLLALLANDNVTPDNALKPTFDIEPTPFSAETVHYLRAITAGDAIGALFGR